MFSEVDRDAARCPVEIYLYDTSGLESDTYLHTELILTFRYRWNLELDIVHTCYLYFVTLI